MCIWLLAVMLNQINDEREDYDSTCCQQFMYSEFKWEESMDAFWKILTENWIDVRLRLVMNLRTPFLSSKPAPTKAKTLTQRSGKDFCPFLIWEWMWELHLEASKIHCLWSPIWSIIWSIAEASFCLRSTSTIPTSESTSVECTSSQLCSESIQSEER